MGIHGRFAAAGVSAAALALVMGGLSAEARAADGAFEILVGSARTRQARSGVVLTLEARIFPVEADGAARVDPLAGDLEITYGYEQRVQALSIAAADPGWTVDSGGRRSWSSPSGSEPPVRLRYDPATGEFTLRARRLRETAPTIRSYGVMLARLDIAVDGGPAVQDWLLLRSRGRYGKSFRSGTFSDRLRILEVDGPSQSGTFGRRRSRDRVYFRFEAPEAGRYRVVTPIESERGLGCRIFPLDRLWHRDYEFPRVDFSRRLRDEPLELDLFPGSYALVLESDTFAIRQFDVSLERAPARQTLVVDEPAVETRLDGHAPMQLEFDAPEAARYRTQVLGWTRESVYEELSLRVYGAGGLLLAESTIQADEMVDPEIEVDLPAGRYSLFVTWGRTGARIRSFLVQVSR